MTSDTHEPIVLDSADTMKRMRPHEGVDVHREPRWYWRLLGWGRPRGHRKGTKGRTLRSWRVGR